MFASVSVFWSPVHCFVVGLHCYRWPLILVSKTTDANGLRCECDGIRVSSVAESNAEKANRILLVSSIHIPSTNTTSSLSTQRPLGQFTSIPVLSTNPTSSLSTQRPLGQFNIIPLGLSVSYLSSMLYTFVILCRDMLPLHGCSFRQHCVDGAFHVRSSPVLSNIIRRLFYACSSTDIRSSSGQPSDADTLTVYAHPRQIGATIAI